MDEISFTDSSGVPWMVREDGADEFDTGREERFPGTAWLRFESDLEVRRLWHYPDDWRGLNPLQLESLLERASTVIARFRPVSHRRIVPEHDAKLVAPAPEAAAVPPPPRTGNPSTAHRRGHGRSDDDPDSR